MAIFIDDTARTARTIRHADFGERKFKCCRARIIHRSRREKGNMNAIRNRHRAYNTFGLVSRLGGLGHPWETVITTRICAVDGIFLAAKGIPLPLSLPPFAPKLSFRAFPSHDRSISEETRLRTRLYFFFFFPRRVSLARQNKKRKKRKKKTRRVIIRRRNIIRTPPRQCDRV